MHGNWRDPFLRFWDRQRSTDLGGLGRDSDTGNRSSRHQWESDEAGVDQSLDFRHFLSRTFLNYIICLYKNYLSNLLRFSLQVDAIKAGYVKMFKRKSLSRNSGTGFAEVVTLASNDDIAAPQNRPITPTLQFSALHFVH
jgi:hypothetical protein